MNFGKFSVNNSVLINILMVAVLVLAAYLSTVPLDVAPGPTIVLLALAGFALTWPLGVWRRTRHRPVAEVARG